VVFAHLGHRVDERDLGGQEGVRRDLHQLGGGEIGDDHRRAGVDDGGEGGAQLLLGPIGVHAEHEPVGVQRVLHGEAFAQELRVPRQLDVLARVRLRISFSMCAAVPAGTVDLPTTSTLRVRCGASDVNADST